MRGSPLLTASGAFVLDSKLQVERGKVVLQLFDLADAE